MATRLALGERKKRVSLEITTPPGEPGHHRGKDMKATMEIAVVLSIPFMMLVVVARATPASLCIFGGLYAACVAVAALAEFEGII